MGGGGVEIHNMKRVDGERGGMRRSLEIERHRCARTYIITYNNINNYRQRFPYCAVVVVHYNNSVLYIQYYYIEYTRDIFWSFDSGNLLERVYGTFFRFFAAK